MKKLFKQIVCIVIAILTLLSCGMIASANEFFDTTPYTGKRIGVQTGTIFVKRAEEYISNPELCYFATDNDAYLALKNGKIDGIVGDEPVLRYMSSSSKGLKVGRIEATPDLIGIVTAKNEHGQKLNEQFNEYLAKIESNGEKDKLYARWFDSKNEIIPINYDDLPDTNGTLNIGSQATYAPFEFVKNGIITGYEIEMVIGFCKEYGYKPIFNNTYFDGLIIGVTTGKYDLASSCFTITEERKKSVLFTDPIFEQYPGFGYFEETESDFWNSLISGFTRTFIEESRWKIFVEGCLVTLKITAFSIIFGTILGFLVHEIYRKGYKIAMWIVNSFDWLFEGTPVVVLLMILYYIILGKTNLGGLEVAIICFTLLFASSIRAMLAIGESTIDIGQTLAAKALGYTPRQINTKIILPQSIRYIVPSYLSTVSSHVKATAVVGYIAVVDLTKVGDIVRGATYEPIFPLIAVAALYFILAAILKIIAKLIFEMFDVTKRTPEQILKGAKIR